MNYHKCFKGCIKTDYLLTQSFFRVVPQQYNLIICHCPFKLNCASIILPAIEQGSKYSLV